MATSTFSRFLRAVATNNPQTDADVWIVPQATAPSVNGDFLRVTEDPTRLGLYQRDDVEDGEYKIYIYAGGGSSNPINDAVLTDENIWHGDERISTISDHFDAADSYKLKATGIKDDAITTVLILDSNVTAGKILNGAVVEAKIGAGAVTEDKIGTSAVVESKVATDAITASKIKASAVTEDKISSLVVSTNKIAAGAVVEDKIASGAVTVNKLGALAVTEAKIDALAVTADKIGASAVTNVKINNGSVTTDKILAANVTLAKISTDLSNFIREDTYKSLSSKTSGFTMDDNYKGLLVLCDGTFSIITDSTNFSEGEKVTIFNIGTGTITIG